MVMPSDRPSQSSVAIFAAGAAVGAAAAAATATALYHTRPTTHAQSNAHGCNGTTSTGGFSATRASRSAWQSVLRLLRLESSQGKQEGCAASARDRMLAAAEARARGTQPSHPSDAATPDGTCSETSAAISAGNGIGIEQAAGFSSGGSTPLSAAPAGSKPGQAHLRLPVHNGARGGVDAVLDDEDEILAEHFTRNTQFFGAEGQRRVAGAFVIVVGLGVR